jgi:uncharacterized hydrophobic protein (TIGR00341 family)
MRMIELSCADGDHVRDIIESVSRCETVDWSIDPPLDGRRRLRALVRPGEGQKLIDAVQSRLEGMDEWRLVVIPVEATVPEPPALEDEAARKERRQIALREEIYQDVEAGANLTRDFLLLTLLSTLVAAVGLNSDSVAAVIGAMVIAPLLGPILAFCFATALGDAQLILKAGRTALVGLTLGLVASLGMGLVIGANTESHELSARAVVGLDSVVLALASGAAAALSIVTGVSSALVGVMVAVALLPPAAAAGLYLGAGEWSLAYRAALLLCVNVVCVNLAALLVFRLKGVRPRTWLERRSAKRSVWINVAAWGALLVVLTIAVLLLPPQGLAPIAT